MILIFRFLSPPCEQKRPKAHWYTLELTQIEHEIKIKHYLFINISFNHLSLLTCRMIRSRSNNDKNDGNDNDTNETNLVSVSHITIDGVAM